MQTISGERFYVTYRIAGTKEEAKERAEDICREQTVELPQTIIPHGFIAEQIVGKIESLTPQENATEAVISYAMETAAGELSQLLNVMFGNVSLKPGIRLLRFQLPGSFLQKFPGPRWGREGLRHLLGVFHRPILCTALKPMGYSSDKLAQIAYECAWGGIDIIKDDHGLTDQPFAPFQERIKACAQAVQKANQKTGKKCIYVANINGEEEEMLLRAYLAKEAGAGGVMMAPGICGFPAMLRIARQQDLDLPILSHPAFQGSYVLNPENGISHYALFGQMARLAGADASIYPSYGGRFSFTKEQCHEICEGTSDPMAHIKPIFPAPGGGMTLARLPELLSFYHEDVILLVGAGLFTHGPDLVENCRYFLETVKKLSSS